MYTHRDRIRDMAIEAGFGIGHCEAAGQLFEQFARLIANDLAGIVGKDALKHSGVTRYLLECSAARVRAAYDETDEP